MRGSIGRSKENTWSHSGRNDSPRVRHAAVALLVGIALACICRVARSQRSPLPASSASLPPRGSPSLSWSKLGRIHVPIDGIPAPRELIERDEVDLLFQPDTRRAERAQFAVDGFSQFATADPAPRIPARPER